MRRRRRRGRASGRAASPTAEPVPRAPHAPSAPTRRRRTRARRACTSARSACAARRAGARGARAAAGTCVRPRGRPRAAGSPPPTPGARPRPGSQGAAPLGPARLDLREDALAELVARTRESERDVGVEALEAPAPPRAADAVTERGAAVPTGHVAGELAPQQPLLLVAGRETRTERGLGSRRLAPALDASGGFEPRHGRDEMAAGEVVRGGERL